MMNEIFSRDEDQIVVSNCFDRVAYDAFDAGSVLDEVQFAVSVRVQRVIEVSFESFHDIKAVAVRERGDLLENLFLGSGHS